MIGKTGKGKFRTEDGRVWTIEHNSFTVLDGMTLVLGPLPLCVMNAFIMDHTVVQLGLSGQIIIDNQVFSSAQEFQEHIDKRLREQMEKFNIID